MAKIYAKCPNCGEIILTEDNQDAGICEKCSKAFITEKAMALYKEKDNLLHTTKKRHVFKSLGKGLLMALECVGYLFYCLFFVWLFVDITDNSKKK